MQHNKLHYGYVINKPLNSIFCWIIRRELSDVFVLLSSSLREDLRVMESCIENHAHWPPLSYPLDVISTVMFSHKSLTLRMDHLIVLFLFPRIGFIMTITKPFQGASQSWNNTTLLYETEVKPRATLYEQPDSLEYYYSGCKKQSFHVMCVPWGSAFMNADDFKRSG